MRTDLIRPLAAVAGAVLAFAALIDRLGLVPAAFACVLIAVLGADRLPMGRALATAALVSTALAGLFVGLLGQPLPLLGSR